MASPEALQAQSKLLQVNQKLDEVKSKVSAREFEENRAKLTLRELNSLPEGRATYKKVGRMFLLTPQDTLKAELTTTVEKVGKELETLRAQQKYQERQLDIAQNAIKEIMFAHAR